MSSKASRLTAMPATSLDFENYRHDQRSFLGLLGDVALEVGADFFFDHAVVGLFFLAGMRKRIFDHASRAFHETVLADVEAASHDFRRRLDSSGELVDGDDG